MPLYEYKCTDCSNDFEILQYSYKDTAVVCPDCGSTAEKVISAGAGFIVKKSGNTHSDCGHAAPCCGRDARCDKPPCGH